MKRKWTPYVIVIMVLVVFSVLGACASTSSSSGKIVYMEIPFSELQEKLSQVKKQGEGFVFEAYITETPAYPKRYFKIVSDPTDTTDSILIPGHNNFSYRNLDNYANYLNSHQLERYEDLLRFDKNRLYRIYVCTYYQEGKYNAIIDNIDGLLEEHNASLIREKEEKEAADEARRLAREEANRYDPANFIVVPSNFQPADYTRRDLFTAVAVSERLEIVAYFPGTYTTYTPSRDFVSEVVFVSQNGTDITFRTDDNAISRSMKVNSRTGLISGQRVRIYYTAYRIHDWQVVAIERL